MCSMSSAGNVAVALHAGLSDATFLAQDAATSHQARLLHELAGARVELGFAAFRAEVIRLAVVLARAGRLGRIHLHAAHNIALHGVLLSLLFGTRKALTGIAPRPLLLQGQ